MITDMQEEQKCTDKNVGSSEMGWDRQWHLMSLFQTGGVQLDRLHVQITDLTCYTRAMADLTPCESDSVYCKYKKSPVRWQRSIMCSEMSQQTQLHNYLYLSYTGSVMSCFNLCLAHIKYEGGIIFRFKTASQCWVLFLLATFGQYTAVLHILLSLWPLKTKFPFVPSASQDVIVDKL